MLSLVVNSVVALASLALVALALVSVPLPKKMVLLIGAGSVFANALCLALYYFHAKFAALYLVSFYTSVVAETTGAIALAVYIYSEWSKGDISPHWFALPTGSSPVAMATKYVSSYVVHLVIFAVLNVLALSSRQSFKDELSFSALFIMAAPASKVLLDQMPQVLGTVNGAAKTVLREELAAYDVYQVLYAVGLLFLVKSVTQKYKVKVKRS